MHLVGSKSQREPDVLYDASGTIVAGATQLVLPVHPSRSHFFFQNNGAHAMFLEVGSARATATLTSGVITSIAVTNAGFNFTYPPLVRFAGGGNGGNSQFLGLNQPGGDGPNSQLTQGRIATAHCVMASSAVTGNKVNSITVDNGGAGFVIAPYVWIMNNQLDPYGCAVPASLSVGSIQIPAGGGYREYNGTTCFTDSVAVFGTANDTFTCKWMV